MLFVFKSLFQKQFFQFCQPEKKRLFMRTSVRRHELQNLNAPVLDLLTKHYRKYYLEQSVADFRKVVLPAKRLRTLDDHIETLKKNDEVACVVNGRDGFEDVDIVLDRFQVSAMKRRVSSNVAPIYIQVPNQQESIRCVLHKISKHPTEEFAFKLHLNRYIVGEPNLLFLPINVDMNTNPYLLRGAQFAQLITGVWVYSYNETYPTIARVDVQNVTKQRPYKLGDLQNSLPEGILLHEKYKKLIHRNVFTITSDEIQKFAESHKDQIRRSESGKQQEKLLLQQKGQADKVPQKEAKVVKKKEFSLKKRVMKVNVELKKEVQETTKAKDAKNQEKTEAKEPKAKK